MPIREGDYPADEAETPAETPEMEDAEEGNEGTTALLPKTIVAGKEVNPGDEIILKVVRLYDDEIEVAYGTKEKEEPEGPDEEIDRMANSPGAMPRRGMMARQGMMSQGMM